jgi:hypothetical protein
VISHSHASNGGVTFVDTCVSLSNQHVLPMCHLGGMHVKGCVINLIGVSKALAIALGTYTIVELEGVRSIYSRRLTSVSFPDHTMHTLFSSNILSPPPAPSPLHNPFELKFHASASTDSTASASSSSAHSSPTEYSLLTRRLQDERQAVEDFRNVEPVTVRRKGHPKLLLMGQRR